MRITKWRSKKKPDQKQNHGEKNSEKVEKIGSKEKKRGIENLGIKRRQRKENIERTKNGGNRSDRDNSLPSDTYRGELERVVYCVIHILKL